MEIGAVSEYAPHAGTVRISGSTVPRHAAGCVVRMLDDKIWPVELLFIGANAGHQATKTMAFLAYLYAKPESEASLVFAPSVCWVYVDDLASGDKQQKKKFCTVWRITILHKSA